MRRRVFYNDIDYGYVTFYVDDTFTGNVTIKKYNTNNTTDTTPITLTKGENKIEDIDFGWHTSGATYSLLQIYITNIDVSKWNSSNVTNMSWMFY